MTDHPLKWTKLSSAPGPKIPLFQVRLDTLRHPTSEATFERVILETADWVNVVAITRDNKVVMVEQYRFGVGELTLEPAAGLIDDGEESLDAGKRELLEETGYGNGTWHYLGAVHANPAIHNNHCHHWLVEGVEIVQEPTPEAGEAIRIHLMTLEQIKAAVADGRLRHSLAMSALSRVFPLWSLPYSPSPTESA